MNKTYSGWHVLYVKSRHEKKVNFLLKESKLESFVPTVTTIRQWSDRKKKIQKPLFPSYVFVNIKSKQEFYSALTIQGVFKYLRFGDYIATVKEQDISIMKGLLKLNGISDVSTNNYLPAIGERMKINSGQLSGLRCQVVKTKNSNRVFVRIDSLGQNIIASIPANFLTLIK